MYILKNALKNIHRNIGRNILILLLSAFIICMSAISMMMHNYASESAKYYASTIGSKVNILASSKETIDQQTLLSFSNSKLLSKSEKIGTIPVLVKQLKTLDGNDNKSAIKWIATSKSEIDESFERAEKIIIEGRKFSKENEVIISKKFVQLNQLSIKDEIIVSSKDGTKDLTLIISGIYNNVSLQADNHTTNQSYTNHWNEIYTSWNTMNQSSLFEDATCTVNLYLKDPSNITKLREELLSKGMPKSYLLSQDIETYNQKMEPIQQLQEISSNMMYGVIIIGAILLVIVSIMAVRERKYEVGVLRSMGMCRMSIAKGFLYESFIITMIALVLSILVSSVLAVPLINIMMDNQGLNINFNQLLSNHNIMTCSLISFVLALVSSASGLFIIMRYEPRRILSEKD